MSIITESGTTTPRYVQGSIGAFVDQGNNAIVQQEQQGNNTTPNSPSLEQMNNLNKKLDEFWQDKNVTTEGGKPPGQKGTFKDNWNEAVNSGNFTFNDFWRMLFKGETIEQKNARAKESELYDLSQKYIRENEALKNAGRNINAMAGGGSSGDASAMPRETDEKDEESNSIAKFLPYLILLLARGKVLGKKFKAPTELGENMQTQGELTKGQMVNSIGKSNIVKNKNWDADGINHLETQKVEKANQIGKSTEEKNHIKPEVPKEAQHMLDKAEDTYQRIASSKISNSTKQKLKSEVRIAAIKMSEMKPTEENIGKLREEIIKNIERKNIPKEDWDELTRIIKEI